MLKLQISITKNPFPAVEWIAILNQIDAENKSKRHQLVQCKNHLPSKVSIEQTSSEKTALYKSTIVSGSTLIDLTGGFGWIFFKRLNRLPLRN
jgi:hypothetical protein